MVYINIMYKLNSVNSPVFASYDKIYPMTKLKITVKKLTFPKRVPEPKEMGREEMKVFEKMSSDNYQR